ncbi:11797_t:CDS:1, partial [Scutellospora calospora]
ITPSEVSLINHEGEPVNLLFAEKITVNPLEEARLSLYKENLKRTDVPIRPFEELQGETWEEQVLSIKDKMCKNRLDQISLLQSYYILEERLNERL